MLGHIPVGGLGTTSVFKEQWEKDTVPLGCLDPNFLIFHHGVPSSTLHLNAHDMSSLHNRQLNFFFFF